MAAAITTTSTTLEAQFLEVAIALQNAEVALNTTPVTNRVTIAPGIEAGTTTVTATLPTVLSSSASGQLVLTATPYA